ncbi:tegument protein UL25 [Aotine betaherpesvirus 1]|uniref:Tegument protein UL25 n=1 Tax=Aotine betaherpesvirus 1 TaxID=50290 RepID=G8XUA0_9BETA|nr:tegument protein UL25 [Aotine betaherpesvirus 1]AEV80731.1 tegument protein UL25 [Aotine betaherpesvirus 1]
MSHGRARRPSRLSLRQLEDGGSSSDEVFTPGPNPTSPRSPPFRDVERGLGDWEPFNVARPDTPVSSFEIIDESNVERRPTPKPHRRLLQPAPVSFPVDVPDPGRQPSPDHRRGRRSRRLRESKACSFSSEDEEDDLMQFTFSASDIEDYEQEPVNRNLNFDLNVMSMEDIALIEASLHTASLQQLARVNECIPMPVYALNHLVDPVFVPAASGEKALARPVVTFAVLLNYYCKARNRVRHMKRVLEATVHGPTVRRMGPQIHANKNRAVVLAIHFLFTSKKVNEGQLLNCLLYLDDELRKRIMGHTPRKTEIYRAIRKHNVLFRASTYTTRDALRLYEENLRRLNRESCDSVKLLCDTSMSPLSIINDLSFLTATKLMIMTLQRNVRALMCYLKHQLHALSLLTYLTYLQFPGYLRDSYLQVTDSIHQSVMSEDETYLYRAHHDMFQFWRAVKKLDALVCPDFIGFALRQGCLGTEAGQGLAQSIVSDRLLREPYDAPFQPRKLVTRNLCYPHFTHLPSYTHTPVEYFFPPAGVLQKLFGSHRRPENDMEHAYMLSAFKNFIVSEQPRFETTSSTSSASAGYEGSGAGAAAASVAVTAERF